MMWMPPFGTFAIWRIAAIVPMRPEIRRIRLVLVVVLERQEDQAIAGERAVDGVDRRPAG